ncbi:MAG: magnesium transporter CorA family protein [Dehalococcoidales bacterium]|nr:magnesium transporter CorA family protein [Dehalococcoidales bacterium]
MVSPQANGENRPKLESLTCGNLTWINIVRPTTSETEYLAQRFPFHHLNLEDVLTRQSRPKLDEYQDHVFLVLHFPVWDDEEGAIVSGEVDIFVGEGYIVTVDYAGNLKSLAELFAACQSDETSRQGNVGRDSAYLLYQIIDRLVDQCPPILDKIEEKVEAIEDVMFARKGQSIVRDISVLRRQVIAFRRIIWPVRAVVTSLESRVRRFGGPDMVAYFRDVVNHLDEIWDGLDEYKEVIEGLSATRDSLASNRINEILRVLTILATIGTMLTVIVSFYGMNIPIPGAWEEAGGSPFTVVVVILLMLVVTGAMLYYFYRKNWI